MKVKKIYIYLLVIVFICLVLGLGFFEAHKGKQNGNFSFITVEPGELIQKVSATGKVTAVKKANLAFDVSGKVRDVFVKVGDQVKQGQKLVELENSDFYAKVSEAKAAVDAQLAKMEEILQGTRKEQIDITKAKIENYKKSLDDAKINLEKVKKKAEADIDKVYNASLNDLAVSVTVAENAVFTITDIQYAHFTGYDQESNKVAQAKQTAIYYLLGGKDAGRWTNDYIKQLDGGAVLAVRKAQSNPSGDNISQAIQELREALSKIKDALDVIPILKLNETEIASLNSEKTYIDAQLSTIITDSKNIEVQKATNDNLIAAAQTQVDSAESSLEVAVKELALEQAGYTQQQIDMQKSQVEEAKANLTYAQNQLAKTILTAPFGGTITKQDAKKGEIVSPGVSIITLLSANKLNIEANIPEVDIVKIKIGDKANITFDAYGNDLIFPGKVIKIDPAEIMIEGVPTYKVTFEFDNLGKNVKPGMTANIDVITVKKSAVIAVPQRSVITKGGKEFVRVLSQNKTIEEREVKTGITGNEGEIEIVEGLKPGDKVVTRYEEK